ncbi:MULTISPECIES: alpha-D-ribose 1-methylphosphonate 5-triphosphate diphosphatase [unclassified Rhizobium]|uniref:alpha-D-ribose 1-methylphosphonate 5-triphosphate diphosphatase n=1 Tax=unclassified Rhizobium TaxID=2613769 RepID=UPI001ADB0562|nr:MULTISPECIES: alpha-D-ribose 1-methylphosphonate 5-triphosphate diphosphatase [unclassified Rhizobium]MBO9123399.1 alpha-D-ribose 1-methylphosphonate 5-triphosphate diphosphatase [Rhizobium sp. 16-488-2b]MBO9173931.1 alpha-D-ribose 1-methylphosphonate 5-triphosphate diphosphatase [Rhizobium sp. 16-488-2a]
MWLSNFTIVLPDEVVNNGSVRIEDGVIAEIRPETVANAAIDGDGRLLMPGFVDLHGDMIEREIAPRPNAMMPIGFSIHELDKKLAAHGVTTAYAAVSFATESVYGHVRSLETTCAVIEGVSRFKDSLLIDHRVHARYEITNVGAAPALEKLLDAGHVDMVSLTDHTPGQGQYNDIQSYILSMAERRAISEEMAAEMVAKRIAMRDNPEIETTLRHIVDLSLRHKLSLASHDDDSAEKVAEMHAMGVTISEFPVTLPAAEEARRRGLWTLMGAPNALRGQSMSGNLSALDAARAGVLSVIAADYHPAAFVPGIFKIAEATNLPTAVAMATKNAARSAGLTDRGEIAIGQRADLVVVEAGDIHRIRATFRGGRFVYSDGTLHQPRAIAA